MTRRPRIYLDHNASAPLLPAARDAIVAALAVTGNPSSVHAHGRAARHLVEEARGQVARLAGAERNQVVFTGSATEAITQAIVGGARALGVAQIVVSRAEHSAVLRAAEATGLPVHSVGLDGQGRIDLGALDAAVKGAADGTALFAMQAVNNETGVVQPLSEIEAMVGPSRHVLFVDAVQAFGRQPLEFSTRATDMMAVSGHKVGGPQGTGALFLKGHCDGARLVPGGGQEKGRRGGTEAVALIAGFGAAAGHYHEAHDPKRIQALTNRVETGIAAIARDHLIFGLQAERSGNVICFAIPGLTSSVATMALDLEGVSVSSGSACSSGKVGRSHVLEAMGVEPALADCALRVSLGWSTTDGDVTEFLAALERVLARKGSRQGQAA